ncbi:MAG TPA: DNRLRE domain-containing protein [Methylomirabilota bacterium]|nr:DNRLRE domain-containing protein [Methylomirabilota bacterium]
MRLALVLIVALQLTLLLSSSSIIDLTNGQSASNTPTDYNRCDILSEQTNSSPLRLHCLVAPSDDAYVENLSPSKTFGDMPILIVEAIPSIPTLRDYAYLKFNVANAVPSQLVQSHARPLDANLSMYVEWINLFYNASIQLHSVENNSWDEHSITWNNQPGFDSNFTQSTLRMNDTWTHWGVTSDALNSLNDGTEVSFAIIPSTRSWKNQVWLASKDYPLDRGLRWPALDLTYVEPYLTIMTPYPNLTVNVDNATFQTDAKGVFQAPFPWGDHHVSVPVAIQESNGTRIGFRSWSDNTAENERIVTLGNNLTLSVDYGKQFRLQAISPYGSVEGSGWYFEDSNANVSVEPTVVPFDGWLGTLGARHVFDHFTEACETSQPNCSVHMAGPETVTAVWRDDYTIPILTIFVAVGLVTFVELTLRRRGKKGRRKR